MVFITVLGVVMMGGGGDVSYMKQSLQVVFITVLGVVMIGGGGGGCELHEAVITGGVHHSTWCSHDGRGEGDVSYMKQSLQVVFITVLGLVMMEGGGG